MKVLRWLPPAVLAGLMGVLFLQWRNWPPQPDWRLPPDTVGVDPGQIIGPAPPDLLARLDALRVKTTYAEVTERPLFLPDRRPPPPQDETTEEPTPSTEGAATLDGMHLTAVIITPDLTLAWVRDPNNPALIRVRAGDDLSGWAVREIRADRLVLERQGQTDTLLLRTYSAPSAAMGPQTPAQPRSSTPTAPQGSALRRPKSLPDRQMKNNAGRRTPTP